MGGGLTLAPIAACATGSPVGSSSAVQVVVTEVSSDQVVATPSCDPIPTMSAVQHVTDTPTADAVRPVVADDAVDVAAAQHAFDTSDGIRALPGCRAGSKVDADPCWSRIEGDEVAAGISTERVVTLADVQNVVAPTPGQIIRA